VKPMAFAGFEEGYIETLKVSWADTEHGRGPTGTAIRTGKPCVCRNMLTDPSFAPWREQALARGYASSLVLPLLADGRAFGAISIYFKQPDAVSENELNLLTELANDVAYGITSTRLREAHARVEEALRESEERLAAFAAATFEGVGVVERGVILDCNDQFAEIAGRPAAQLRGMPVEQLIAPEDRERVMENICSNRESVIEHQMVRPDGSRLTVEVHGRPSGGRRFSAIRDITERKRIEEALRLRTRELQQLTETLERRVMERTAELAEANELLQAEVTHSHFIEADLSKQKETLQTLIDNIPVMLCFYDAAGRAKLTNREFGRLLGWSKGEAEDLDIAPGKTRDAAAPRAIDDSAADGIPGWREYSLRTRDGAALESSWATVRLSDGGQIGIGLDMRERNAAEVERLRLATAVEQAWEGMAIMDSKGRISYANSAFEETAGARRTDIIGAFYFDLLSGQDENRDLAEAARKTVEAGETWNAHLTRKKSTEQARELDIRITPIRDRSGNIISLLVVERDVTREVRLQQHLRQAQKLEALGTLAGGIAHDFNNILNPIFINTELVLLDAALDDESRSELELSLQAAERGRDLVRQIITFSRQKEKERRPSKIGPVVTEALKFLRSTLSTAIEIREHVGPETGFVLADPSQIHQIVMNLCNNSAYAMRETGGVLHVGLAEVEVDRDMATRHPDIKPGPFVRLTITDTGTGMAPDVLERAFDPFFTTKRPGEGSGMGLAVVHGIVRDYDGAVTVYSEVGMGTTFNIFFPSVPSKEIQTQETLEILPKGKESILLVDDEETQVQSMRNMLKRLGHRVVAKTDPEEALKAFRNDPSQFDLVITDQTMPRLSGAHLAEEILRLKPGLPIILCTGFSEKVDAHGAHSMGISRFLMKPFSIREMAAAINQALKKD
jgi:PAS domain S-box-containing protein